MRPLGTGKKTLCLSCKKRKRCGREAGTIFIWDNKQKDAKGYTLPQLREGHIPIDVGYTRLFGPYTLRFGCLELKKHLRKVTRSGRETYLDPSPKHIDGSLISNLEFLAHVRNTDDLNFERTGQPLKDEDGRRHHVGGIWRQQSWEPLEIALTVVEETEHGYVEVFKSHIVQAARESKLDPLDIRIIELRSQGLTWAEVAERVGTKKDAVRKKHGRLLERYNPTLQIFRRPYEWIETSKNGQRYKFRKRVSKNGKLSVYFELGEGDEMQKLVQIESLPYFRNGSSFFMLNGDGNGSFSTIKYKFFTTECDYGKNY